LDHDPHGANRVEFQPSDNCRFPRNDHTVIIVCQAKELNIREVNCF
jgi:hypothetical protein